MPWPERRQSAPGTDRTCIVNLEGVLVLVLNDLGVLGEGL